jgi:hypothetical protein
MHDSGTVDWRDVAQKHHSAMVDELSTSFDSRLQRELSSALHDFSIALDAERAKASNLLAVASAEASNTARRAQAESLNQALRRLRAAETRQEILNVLSENTAPYCTQSVVLLFETSQARIAAARGLPGRQPKEGIPVEQSPALLACIESRDRVVALALPEQLSAPLSAAFESEAGSEEHEKAYLFPITSRQAVVAVLVATGEVNSPPLELMCEAVAMRLEALTPVAPQGPAKSAESPLSWNALSSEDQALHLQAQRMARVRVAEMRLRHSDALAVGLQSANIYGSPLKGPIDDARKIFLQSFLSKSTTMVDYLHLEILRSLANDDDRLMGPDYPGPMV